MSGRHVLGCLLFAGLATNMASPLKDFSNEAQIKRAVSILEEDLNLESTQLRQEADSERQGALEVVKDGKGQPLSLVPLPEELCAMFEVLTPSPKEMLPNKGGSFVSDPAKEDSWPRFSLLKSATATGEVSFADNPDTFKLDGRRCLFVHGYAATTSKYWKGKDHVYWGEKMLRGTDCKWIWMLHFPTFNAPGGFQSKPITSLVSFAVNKLLQYDACNPSKTKIFAHDSGNLALAASILKGHYVDPESGECLYGRSKWRPYNGLQQQEKEGCSGPQWYNSQGALRGSAIALYIARYCNNFNEVPFHSLLSLDAKDDTNTKCDQHSPGLGPLFCKTATFEGDGLGIHETAGSSPPSTMECREARNSKQRLVISNTRAAMTAALSKVVRTDSNFWNVSVDDLPHKNFLFNRGNHHQFRILEKAAEDLPALDAEAYDSFTRDVGQLSYPDWGLLSMDAMNEDLASDELAAVAYAHIAGAACSKGSYNQGQAGPVPWEDFNDGRVPFYSCSGQSLSTNDVAQSAKKFKWDNYFAGLERGGKTELFERRSASACFLNQCNKETSKRVAFGTDSSLPFFELNAALVGDDATSHFEGSEGQHEPMQKWFAAMSKSNQEQHAVICPEENLYHKISDDDLAVAIGSYSPHWLGAPIAGKEEPPEEPPIKIQTGTTDLDPNKPLGEIGGVELMPKEGPKEGPQEEPKHEPKPQ